MPKNNSIEDAMEQLSANTSSIVDTLNERVPKEGLSVFWTLIKRFCDVLQAPVEDKFHMPVILSYAERIQIARGMIHYLQKAIEVLQTAEEAEEFEEKNDSIHLH